MTLSIIGLILSLAIILISCELFTNGIEWMGKHLKLGDGVIGSIFSAVGTCLPETTVPIIAILFSNNSKNSLDIGIGAIIGAPFMLSTLAFFVSGASVLIFWKRRKTGMKMNVNNGILSRDIGFFIIVYAIGISASFINFSLIRIIIAVFLLTCYIYYIILTVKQDSHKDSELDPLHFNRFLNVKPNLPVISFQVLLALSGIIFGAELFVQNMEDTSKLFGISALALSLIITPIATELPEKFNSVIWIRKKKDTLALGNITGAMVFQSCIPVSIGIFATTWKLEPNAIASATLAILSASFTYLWIKIKGKLNPIPLLVGGVFYLMFIAFLIM